MRDDSRSDPQILQHLHKENVYTQAITGHLQTLRDELYDEMVGSVKENDWSVPMRMDEDGVYGDGDGEEWWYYTRTCEGMSYRMHCRAPAATMSSKDTSNQIDANNIHRRPSTEDWDGTANTPVMKGEETYLDENILAMDHEYCAVRSVQVITLPEEEEGKEGGKVSSSSRDWVAYTVDFTGNGVYSLWVVTNSATGRIIDQDEGLECCGQLIVGRIHEHDNDNDVTDDGGGADGHAVIVSLFYVKMDTTKRPFQVYRRRISSSSQRNNSMRAPTNTKTNSNNNDDELIYQELDPTFTVSLSKSSDNRYLLISSSSSETSEVHYLDLDDEETTMSTKRNTEDASTSTTSKMRSTTMTIVQCITRRQKGVFYDVAHWNGWWLVSTNVGGTPNRRLMIVKVAGRQAAVAEEEKTFSSPLERSTCSSSSHYWKDVVGMVGVAGKKEEMVLFDGEYNNSRSLDQVRAFRDHIVLGGREDGMPQIWVIQLSSSRIGKQGLSHDGCRDDIEDIRVKSFTRLTFEESAYDARIGPKQNYDTSKLVVWYNSLTTPFQVLEVLMVKEEKEMDNSNSRNSNDGDLSSKEGMFYNKNRIESMSILKQTEIPGYNKEEYRYHRTTVMSRDGTTEIPVSMVYRADVMDGWKRAQTTTLGEGMITTNTTVPVHLYGYGSYGACCEADFSAGRLPLMNRGIVFVCAHVRGGGEIGRQWYEEPNGGKYLCKKNTFNDFCDVAKWLVEDQKLTTPQQLSCEGRSAGGLLIGASINQEPELFRVAILRVPFVDVVCSMVDSTLPLTCEEWEEWGNPNEEKFFDYMMEYSPMNNVKQDGTYPACLITGGLYDPSVQYWEPAKFVAQLRYCHNTDSSGPVCLKMNMSAGHFSSSSRYSYLSELAFDYAFLLDQMGLYPGDRKKIEVIDADCKV